MSKQSELVALSRTTRLDEVDSAYGSNGLSNRNLIINGEFLVWQRSDNGYIGGGTGYPSADRFSATRGRIRKPNTNGNTGEDNRGAILDSTDNNVYVHFDYKVEDVDQKLHGKTMTFSFYAKLLSGQASLYIQDAGGDHFDIGGDQFITLTSNWERYTFTGTIVSTGAAGGVVMPRLYLNPNGTALARMIQIDQVQLELGDVATPFEHRSYGDELARCQRYFNRMAENGNNAPVGSGYYHGVSTPRIYMAYQNRMRVAPTLSFSALNTFIIQDGTNRTPTAITAVTNIDTAMIQVTVSASKSVNDGCNLLTSGGSFIDVDAEL